MTREEQMWEAVTKEHGELSRRESFVTLSAMEWADEHPNLSEEEQVGMGELGMMWQKKHLIDKACKWLLKGGYFVNNTETINDFKKAMEE